jgi:hypothetical protein
MLLTYCCQLTTAVGYDAIKSLLQLGDSKVGQLACSAFSEAQCRHVVYAES